ncbi:MAG: hypothetical protein HRU76_09085 [Phycisphaeraceae bacterium]|nr:MAG: hypothetical protein HRU76_09085 [Phycisphaeraceae bacterium]
MTRPSPANPRIPPRQARDAVAQRLADRCRCFPDLPLEPMDVGGLDDREQALARAIDHAVTRHWLTLVAVVQSRLSRPWEELEPDLQAILLTGAAQLLTMDRLPDHAVVNHAVEWTRRHGQARAAGLVNAVLRAVVRLRAGHETPAAGAAIGEVDESAQRSTFPLSDGRLAQLHEPVFAREPVRRLAQRTSHPEPLLHEWINMFGVDQATRLAWHDVTQPPLLLRRDGDPSAASETPPGTRPHREPGCLIYTGPHGGLSRLLEAHPNLSVQDPASAIPVTLTGGLRPALIVDLCAGLGTKTRQLARLHPEARIVCSDADPARLDALRSTFRGSDRVAVLAPGDLLRFAGQCDLVVLDVPCSNTGVLPRRLEARYRFNAERLAELVSLQRGIIADGLRLRAPGGSILYATCSLEPAENERQAAWIEQWHPLKRANERFTLPQGLPGADPAEYRDGGYAALLGPV